MEIFSLDRIDSTQIYLKNALKDGLISAPALVYTLDQTSGIGSRDNSWQGAKGNLALSFVLDKATLPDDLPLQSSSIYFATIFKIALGEMGSKIWVKWPNDLYIEDKKCGGVITQVIGSHIVCGVGLNISAPSKLYGEADVDISVGRLIEIFVNKLSQTMSWQAIFSHFELEFEASRNYTVHTKTGRVLLKNALLEPDGSIVIGDERVFSNR